nr:metal-dependent transcriptional regulator [Chloroflexota bacterium]
MMDNPSALSENIQMYLVNILRLGAQGQPVPLSQLAAVLAVSPISVNQMCRKLQDEGLVTYIPYKGVSISPAGKQLAARILRSHRLWEVFLVEHLQIGWEKAHETACRLEHDTPDEVIERLDAFLNRPRFNPQGEPIPTPSGEFTLALVSPLTDLKAGQMGSYVRCTADEETCAFLAAQGLRPGASLRVLAVALDSILVEVNGKRVALDRSVAATLQVEQEEQKTGGTHS